MEATLLGKTLRLLFSTATDVALVPSLFAMAQYRRHFELFLGMAQVGSALLYNFCQSVGGDLYLTEGQWHKVNNVLVVAYIQLLAIHLLVHEDENVNIILRYLAFSLSVLTQVRDGFWMESSHHTIVVVSLAIAAPFVKHAREFALKKKKPPFDPDKLTRGLACGAGGGLVFLISLSGFDSLRFFHGCAHLLFGAALWYLWGIVPNLNKKFDVNLRASSWA